MSTATIKVDSVPVSEEAPFPVSLQDFLLTDPSNQNSRLRVDVGQTGFFAGREFRTFKDFSISNGATYVVKFVSPVNFFLFDLSFTLISGEVKMTTATGGTEGGSFAETLPVIARNTMSERPTPVYEADCVLTAGGTHTGGTVLDIVWGKVTDNSNKVASSDTLTNAETGFAAGTYYFRLNALSTATGVLHLRWEERP